jgi:hypothetical protein
VTIYSYTFFDTSDTLQAGDKSRWGKFGPRYIPGFTITGG